MSDSAAIDFRLDLVVKEGREAEFAALREDLLCAVREEPGTIAYEWARSGERVSLHERYRDSAAALDHLGAFRARFAMRFSEILDGRGMDVFGPASETLRGQLAPHAPRYFERLDAFVR